jgi:hypothetical protein
MPFPVKKISGRVLPWSRIHIRIGRPPQGFARAARLFLSLQVYDFPLSSKLQVLHCNSVTKYRFRRPPNSLDTTVEDRIIKLRKGAVLAFSRLRLIQSEEIR